MQQKKQYIIKMDNHVICLEIRNISVLLLCLLVYVIYTINLQKESVQIILEKKQLTNYMIYY